MLTFLPMVMFYHSLPIQLATVHLIHSGYKAHQDLAMASYPISSVKERCRKGGKCKISLVLQLPVPKKVPKPHQGWRQVTDISRLNTFLLVERFKWKLQNPSGPP